MSNDEQSALALGLGLIGILVVLFFVLVLYVFYSFCYKRVCEKCGKQPGAIIWIPIARYVPLMEVAKLPVWLVILLLLPLVNFAVFLVLWFKLCEARGKSGWLVILFFVPIANLVLIPYLAFAD